ncbi:unnamed protein product [Rotaria magnacalcarata]|uniref:Major facilitator superfamily (MFS) profile domain-containing protein n=1 Tax=Rotaria magnacalcarata TaxID=392030 RepID=A0A819N3G0_9BILA|nr:unnamed protein product [Rotaria magnacalcarata]CAF1561787.1 unnamed protein product [Rotaria magnacalcarata]CAF2092957.1 unnamed protein product [Rotaria magnacalcarata]CAF2134899.1 unnamed protein product [Rotaria magnacalcarata]CAF3989292.1 unnamed protein product [Rotaria magnacalcarata]
MNTDHINYQQKIAQSMSEEKYQELLTQSENAPKQQINSTSTGINRNSISTNDESQSVNQTPENSMNILTPIERRERTLTLFVIGFISLLTGIDYAIILPTAWGYINTFMQYHYGGFVMGILLSVFALSGAIAGIILGYLNDVGISLKRLVLFGIMFKIIGNILYFIGINIYIVVISRLIAGIGMGLVPPLLAELSRRSTPKNRTQLLSKILGCRQIGLLVGPCFTIFFKQMKFNLLGINVTMHNAPGLLMAILWAILALLTVFFFFDLPTTTVNHKSISNSLNDYTFLQAMKRVYKICKQPVIIVLLITSFIAYFNQTALETTLTPFTNQQFNWHELQVSILFAVAGIEITLVYVLLHFMTKKYPDQSILLFGYILLSIACLIAVIILPFSEPGTKKYLPIFLIFVALDILALPLIVVTTTSLFTQQTNHDEQGIGQGIQRFVINVATIVGPLYAGSLLQFTWTMLCSMLFIVLLGTFLIVAIYRSFKRKHDEELAALISPTNNNR